MSKARTENPINFNWIVFVSYVNSETNRAKHLPGVRASEFLLFEIMMNSKHILFDARCELRNGLTPVKIRTVVISIFKVKNAEQQHIKQKFNSIQLN